MAHIRTFADLDRLRPLTPAEEKLLIDARDGRSCFLGRKAPDACEWGAEPPERHIRAPVLRYLVLGGCDAWSTDRSGIGLQGALITGKLSLNFCTNLVPFQCRDSRLTDEIFMVQAHIGRIDFVECHIAGWRATGIRVEGHLSLRKVIALGTLDISGAKIGGDLSFTGAKLKRGVASNNAVFAQGVQVGGGLIWRDVTVEDGRINFNGGYVTVLSDDQDSWQSKLGYSIIGFTYDRIISASTSARDRLPWLAGGSYLNGKFNPDPYTHLAKVLRSMGHDRDAAQILCERDRRLWRAERARIHRSLDGSVKMGFASLWWDLKWGALRLVSALLRLIAGYGHHPFRTVWTLLGLILFTTTAAHFAWQEGSFAPNSDVVQTSAGWRDQSAHPNPAAIWSGDSAPPGMTLDAWRPIAPGRDWESFSALAYGLDVVVPIINFGQTEAWAPSTTRHAIGWHLWWLRWAMTLAGWIVSALGLAAVTGIINRR